MNLPAQIKETKRIPAEMMPKTEEQALQILKSYPLEYYNSLTPKTCSDVFNSPTCSIVKYKKEEGETKARALVAYMISDCIECFNVGKSMNDVQIARTADLIIEEFYFLKPDDLKLCFNRAMLGKYGKTYDRVDTQVICDWLNQYNESRALEADSLSYQEHLQVKEKRNNNEEYIIKP
jgi:hypothetical protein